MPRWAVWRLPLRLLGAVLVVDVAAAVLLGAGLLDGPLPNAPQLRAAAVLAVLGVAYVEGSLGVERVRRRLGIAGHVDLSSVWTFAAALVLPAPWAAVLAALVLTHLWARAWRQSVPLHRHVFGVAAVVLACLATGAVLRHLDPGAGPAEHPLWLLLVAMAAYAAVNAGLTALVAALDQPRTGSSALLGQRDEHLLELGMLCLGALTALALALNPWLVLLVPPPLLAVLRAALVRPLEAAASTDGKTGLLNAAAWYAEADRLLCRPDGAERAGGVLVLDLDHFKAVNDTHGHVVGDRVLAAVADAVRRTVRAHDLVGRLGGEEFAVMPRRAAYGARSVELESVELEVVAERIRARVAQLSIEVATPGATLALTAPTVSIGGAVPPVEGTDLATLLHAADTALYAAKRAGRNTVRIGVAPPPPAPVPLTGRADGQPGTDP